MHLLAQWDTMTMATMMMMMMMRRRRRRRRIAYG